MAKGGKGTHWFTRPKISGTRALGSYLPTNLKFRFELKYQLI